MKVASRFPIKESKGLFWLILLLHLLVFILCVLILEYIWQFTVVLASLLVSFHFSLKQLKQITQAPDDLCWTGDKWLIRIVNIDNKLDYNESIYLNILPSSWITSEFSLLKFEVESFDAKNAEYAWFFHSSNLGDRVYRELCYLCKQALKEQSRVESDKLD